ncbi:MAG TPA: hypothetical protein VFD84_15485 [Candidatus Binatia bacterium]|nr:hypothetical protein [Candidatus Binatia bacterium]
MRDAPWRKLVLELKERGCESPYLDRLRQRLDVEQSQQALETEIVQEMAAALGRTEEKLLHALLRLELARRDLDAAAEAERPALAARFDACRAEALARRHELQIHREAVGIRRNAILETLYPIPARRR